MRDDRRVVLVVGVDHDDDVRAALEGRPVAGLLVAAVAAVLRVHDDVDAQLPRDLDRAVARAVVDEDDVVHVRLRHVGVRPLERLLGVVRGHDDGDPATGRALGTGHQIPRRVRTTGSVRSRIARSRPNDQLFK